MIATASMHVTLDTRLFGQLSGGDTDTGFGDMLLTPFAFYWSFGELNVKVSQWVVAPTGHYYVNSLINVGRNYWAFDTQLGITWFHKATGTELTMLPGIMLNTTNPATDYKSGNEFHLDFMANQFLAPTFALGLQGCVAFRLKRAFGLSRFGFGLFGLADISDRPAIDGTRRSRRQPFGERRIGGLGEKFLQCRLLGLGGGLLPFEEIRILKAGHFSRPRLSCRRSESSSAPDALQRARQPTTVASMGVLVATLCQTPLCHRHRNGMT